MMRTGRRCDWCQHDALMAFMVPVPAGAVTPESYTTIDFCGNHSDAAVAHLDRVTADRPYPTDVGFVVIGA